MSECAVQMEVWVCDREYSFIVEFHGAKQCDICYLVTANRHMLTNTVSDKHGLRRSLLIRHVIKLD